MPTCRPCARSSSSIAFSASLSPLLVSPGACHTAPDTIRLPCAPSTVAFLAACRLKPMQPAQPGGWPDAAHGKHHRVAGEGSLGVSAASCHPDVLLHGPPAVQEGHGPLGAPHEPDAGVVPAAVHGDHEVRPAGGARQQRLQPDVGVGDDGVRIQPHHPVHVLQIVFDRQYLAPRRWPFVCAAVFMR